MKDHAFPDGARVTPVPDLFFSRDLPDLPPPALQVALVVLWRIHRRPRGTPPALPEDAVVSDAVLGRSLGLPDPEARPAILAAIDALVARGNLLEARVASDHGPLRWVLVNNREGRAAWRRWQAGGLVLPEAAGSGATGARVRPSVYAVYEENIGLLTPLIAETLGEAEATYPEGWIEDAIRTAVEHNARRWSYVRAILERWAREGRDDAASRTGDRAGRERDSDGPYGRFIRH